MGFSFVAARSSAVVVSDEMARFDALVYSVSMAALPVIG